MMKPGSRPLDYATVDLAGNPRQLHQFRHKAHVVLIWDPKATPEQRAQWGERRAAEAQRWTWIQAETLVPTADLGDVAPGNYLINRWGNVIAVHPPGLWDMDRIEKDFLTFESQDCCDLSKAP